LCPSGEFAKKKSNALAYAKGFIVAAYNGVNYSPLTKCKWAMYIASNQSSKNANGYLFMLQAKMDGWMQMGMYVCEQSRKDE
jgi:hypothetical protein